MPWQKPLTATVASTWHWPSKPLPLLRRLLLLLLRSKFWYVLLFSSTQAASLFLIPDFSPQEKPLMATVASTWQSKPLPLLCRLLLLLLHLLCLYVLFLFRTGCLTASSS